MSDNESNLQTESVTDVGSNAASTAAATAASAAAVAGYTAAAIATAAAGKALEMATAKAMLYIRMLGKGGLDTTGASTNQDVKALRSLRKQKLKVSEKLAERAGQMVKQTKIMQDAVKTKMSEVEVAAGMLQSGFLPMPVQYNPASLRMNTMGGRIIKYTAVGNETPNSIQNTDKETSTYLSVQLVFEDINNADAFGKSTFSDATVNISNSAEVLKSTVINAAKEGYSVRRETEGLMSLLMTKRTRQIIFVWNNMFFHGDLLSVDINYTMFNKLGNPIKATVDLQIQQSNANATFTSDMEYWNEVFEKAFDQSSMLEDMTSLFK